MAYSVSYTPTRFDKLPPEKKRSAAWAVTGAVMLALVVLASLIWPERVQTVKESLFPFTRTATKQALTQLAEDIGEGESVKDAVTAFCLEVLNEQE